ncbi:MAG TPA: hypothetical protein VJ576_21300 [Rhodocyclaceae bacterium]|nr:hypothetical protein [Rhodocyclaceae bacterium]
MSSHSRTAHRAADRRLPPRRGNAKTFAVSSIAGALLLFGFHSFLQASVANPADAGQQRLIPVAKASPHAGQGGHAAPGRQAKGDADHAGGGLTAISAALADFFGVPKPHPADQTEMVTKRIAPVARFETAGSEAMPTAPVEPAGQAAASATPAEPAAAAAASPETARALVDEWLHAWSERDVDRYLGAYGEGFTPENGLSRQAWAQSRRQKIESRKSIAVSIRDLKIEPEGDNRLAVHFLQDYTADGFHEEGTPKHLTLALEAGAWRIVAEASGATPAASK